MPDKSEEITFTIENKRMHQRCGTPTFAPASTHGTFREDDRSEKTIKFPGKSSEGGGTRTHDQLIKSQLLYRLSYALIPTKSG